MSKHSDRATLGWIRKLPELGAVVRYPEDEQDIIEKMAQATAAYREQMKLYRKALRRVVKDAQAAVSSQWTAEEIAEAKRVSTPHAAIPSHDKGDPGTRGCEPWCLSCFADVTDPVHKGEC